MVTERRPPAKRIATEGGQRDRREDGLLHGAGRWSRRRLRRARLLAHGLRAATAREEQEQSDGPSEWLPHLQEQSDGPNEWLLHRDSA
jgi:hypothetical protein